MRRLRLPIDETDERKRYSMPYPDDERYGEVRRRFVEAGEITQADGHYLFALAEAYLHLTTYPLGQERCVHKLRDIWRARRAASLP